MTIYHIGLHRIMLPEPPQPDVVAAKVLTIHLTLAASPSYMTDPIEVRAEGRKRARYRIVNGRHRFLAYVLAGRTEIPCVVVD